MSTHDPICRHSGAALVYGHRGASAYEPDNTIAAFRLAADQGAAGVELDVRFSRDGALVIHHDVREPDGPRFLDMDLAEIRHAFPHVPTLDETWAAVGERLFLNIEIKVDESSPTFDVAGRLADAVTKWIEASEAVERVFISSFDTPALTRFKASAPHVATGHLLSPVVDPLEFIGFVARGGHQTINVHVSRLQGEAADRVVTEAADAGLGVVVWTIDDPDDIRRLSDAGVFAVITNDPATAVEALSSTEATGG